MKKLLAAAVAVLVLGAAGSAFGDARQNVGCGFGTMLFKEASNNSTVLQSIQFTLNALFGNATFGITSGTSECKTPSSFVSNKELNEFVVANMDNLAKDMARGRGETLEAFAELLQVPQAERPVFYQKLQANFSAVFTSDKVVLADVVDNTVTVSAR
jgi:hypothetical protein